MSAAKFLFELIHSLDKNEKRFFRLFTNMHSNKQSKKYIEVYDILLKTKKFEETKALIQIREKLQKKNVNHILKNLKEQILDSLSIYHRNNHSFFKQTSTLFKIHLLIKKKHYKEAQKLLMEQKREAEEKEFYELSYNINRYEIDLNGVLLHRTLDFYEEADVSYQLMLENIDKLQEIVHAKQLHNKIRQLIYNKYLTNTEQSEKILTLLQHCNKILQSNSIRSLKAKFYYLQSAANCYGFGNQNTSDYISCLEQSIELANQNPNLFVYGTTYIPLTNLTKLYIQEGEHEKFHQSIKELGQIAEKIDRVPKSLVFFWKNMRLLEYYIFYKKTINSQELQDITNFIHHTATLSKEQQTALLLKLGHYFFNSSNYTECQEVLNEILGLTLMKAKDYYYASARSMYVLCFYELRLYDLATREILSFRRKLKREGFMLNELNELLNFISLIVNTHHENKQKIKLNLNKIIALFEANQALYNKVLFIKDWAKTKLVELES